MRRAFVRPLARRILYRAFDPLFSPSFIRAGNGDLRIYRSLTDFHGLRIFIVFSYCPSINACFSAV